MDRSSSRSLRSMANRSWNTIQLRTLTLRKLPFIRTQAQGQHERRREPLQSPGTRGLATQALQQSNTSCSRLKGCASKASPQWNATHAARPRPSGRYDVHHATITLKDRERGYLLTFTHMRLSLLLRRSPRCLSQTGSQASNGISTSQTTAQQL
jgi:hypothetical protein